MNKRLKGAGAVLVVAASRRLSNRIVVDRAGKTVATTSADHAAYFPIPIIGITTVCRTAGATRVRDVQGIAGNIAVELATGIVVCVGIIICAL